MAKVIDIDVTTLGTIREVFPDKAALRISELAASDDGSLVIGATKINSTPDTVQFIRCSYDTTWSYSVDEYNDGILSNSLHDMEMLGNDVIALVSTGNKKSVVRRNAIKAFSWDADTLGAHWSFTENENSKWFNASSIAIDGVGAQARIYVGGYVKHAGRRSGLILGLDSDLQLDREFAVNGIMPDKQNRKHRIAVAGPLLVDSHGVHLPMLSEYNRFSSVDGSYLIDPVLSYHGPKLAEMDGNQLSDYKFADGVDLAVATFTNVLPSPTEPTFPGFSAPIDGLSFQCIGIGGPGPAQLRQGEFSAVKSVSGLVEIKSKSGHEITYGDSGGPCFASTGSLVGIISSSPGASASTGTMVSGDTAEEFVNSLSSQP